MTQPHISFRDVSLRFQMKSVIGLKEAVLEALRPSAWSKPRQPVVKYVLQHLNLEVKAGDRLAILGANGAGKSTLLKLISRIYQPTSGQIRVAGSIAPLIELGAGFNPELTGRENAFLNAAILGVPGRVLRRHLPAIIDFSGLDAYFDAPVKHYSTGMLLRLAFAVATEISPDILILDEMFAGADASFVTQANARLDEFIKRSPIFLLVSHNLADVRRLCNRAIVLHNSEIIFDGEPEAAIATYLNSLNNDLQPQPTVNHLPHNSLF